MRDHEIGLDRKSDTAPQVPAGRRNGDRSASPQPGVVRDFAPSLGTGAGGSAQDIQQLEFLTMSRIDPTTAERPPLDRWRLDDVLEPDRHLWGLTEIARAAGVSVDTARRWYHRTDAPISKPGGRYFSTRRAMLAWLNAR